MAIIKTSGLGITEISGKVGGSVFSKSGSGLSVRSKRTKLKGDTQANRNRTAQFNRQVQFWRLRTTTQLREWQRFSASSEYFFQNRLGEWRPINAMQNVIQQNYYRGFSGAPTIGRPTRKQNVPAVTITFTSLRQTATNTVVTITASVNLNTTWSAQIFATPPMSAGASVGRNFRQIGYMNAGTNLSSGAGYISIFGRCTVGARVFVKVVYHSRTTGTKKVMFVGSRICTV